MGGVCACTCVCTCDMCTHEGRVGTCVCSPPPLLLCEELIKLLLAVEVTSRSPVPACLVL